MSTNDNSGKFDVFSTKFAQDIYLQKYSMNGTETWSDTCTRVVNAVCGQLLDTKTKNKILKFMQDRKFIPGGRYLYSAGRSFHQVNNCFDGEERFITRNGIKSFRETVGMKVEVRNWKGEWEKAEVKSFGSQSIFKVTFSNGDSILTTDNHLWIQPDGSRVPTKDLKRVMLTSGDTDLKLDEEGIRHGIIFGDGYRHPKTGYCEIVIANPKKDEPLVSFFEDKEISITVGFGATVKYRTIRKVKAGTKIALQPMHYKDLPSDCSPEYARGFIAGLIATDGHASLGGSVLISCEGFAKAKKISELAVLGGCVVSSVRVNSRVNPFNGKPRELTNIYIKPFSAPIILPYHQNNMKNRKFYHREMYLDVVNIEPINESREVFCVVAPETHTFTLANGVLTSNCFLFRAEDTREGWADLMGKASSALLTGGGIGIDYSKIRHRGAPIRRTGGFCTGPISLAEMVNEAGRFIMQGGARRSAIWAGLEWSHKDIYEFLNIKNYSPELKAMKAKDFNFRLPMEYTNISVIYDTNFFIAIEDEAHPSHKEAKDVWMKNCLQAFSTAEPGMSFNFRKDAESLRNACVTGDTLILTDDGYKPIGSLVDQVANVWNGFEWSEVCPKITGLNQEIFTVSFSDGRVLNCTPNHKFHIANGYSGKSDVIDAKDLEAGMKLIKHNFPVIEHGEDYKYAYTQGFISAEGMDGYDFCWVYEPKRACLNRLQGNVKAQYKERLAFKFDHEPLPKSFVPFKWNLKSKLDWLAGLFDGDGTELKEGGLQLASVDHVFLTKLQALLSTLGAQSKIVMGNLAGMRSMPDGHGGHKNFNCQTTWRVCIGAVQMQELKSLGLKCERMSFDKTPQRDASQFVKIVDVTSAGMAEKVYCFNESKRHLGIFNGVLTGQCTEVVSEDDSDKCNLGTVWMNRCKDKEEFAEAVRLSTLFLLCGGIYSDVPTEKIKEIGLKNNRIGLGLGGMHEWLMSRGHKYQCVTELHKWLTVYERESDSAAFIGAKQLGVAVPKGVRAIAPTGSIGILAETSTGLEPLFCKAYKRRYLNAEQEWSYQYVVDGAVKRLLASGIKLEVIQDSFDISFKERVKFQADVQQYVDMAISSTCNMPSWGSEDNNEKTLEKNAMTLLKYAQRLRGFTVYPDGCREGQPLTRVDLTEALANEGVIFEEKESECLNGVCGI